MYDKIDYEVRALRVPPYLREDARQEGLLGALDAASRFNAELGGKLASWQCQRVKGAILDFLRREDPLNRHQRKEVKDGAASEVSVVCIDKITYRVASPPNDLPTEIEARRWLSFLTPRERRVIVGMFWLQETDAEIAEVVGVSCGRVRGIRAEAVQRIRSRIRWSGKAAA